jgi:hypothetical protein
MKSKNLSIIRVLLELPTKFFVNPLQRLSAWLLLTDIRMISSPINTLLSVLVVHYGLKHFDLFE